MNKNAVFLGMFYPDKPEELTNLLESFKQDVDSDYKSKAIIVPHAGISYSGFAAMAAFQRLEENENIFIIAPSHHENFQNIALPKYTFFDTPLGSVEVNNKLIKDIAEKFPCSIDDELFEQEHAIEVQLPFIQNLFSPQLQNAMDFVKGIKHFGKKYKIIPILTGNCEPSVITDIIRTYWGNSSFVISADLSHYYPHEEARRIDAYTATIIETGKSEFLQSQQSCGLIGIKGLVDYANSQGYSLIRTIMYNSGDVSNDKDKVVGYGSWFLYEGERNNYITRYHQKYILNVARASILAGINEEEFIPHNIPTVLNQYGASFITINKKENNTLRGCIGSVYPTKPLILDIIDNAKGAGFQDPRFVPITQEEFYNLKITVSILSSIERIDFKDERDLLSKIYPYGIIIAFGNHRAVYLPEVWEQLPDREAFLSSLKEKAGLNPEFFSNQLEAYKFETVLITE